MLGRAFIYISRRNAAKNYYAALVGHVGVGYSENYGQGELRTYDTETTKNPDQHVGESLLVKLYALC
jgi:hypothetical protein